MPRGEIATLKDAQQFLAQQHAIHYQSLGGVWWLLRQRKVRLKTGRRRHRQADLVAQTEYQGRLRSDLLYFRTRQRALYYVTEVMHMAEGSLPEGQ